MSASTAKLTPAERALLTQFDANNKFGPAIGIPRLSRWRRAEALGLQPPADILALLEAHAEEERKIPPYGRMI